jgi:predicted PurR-regulated permease PerM
MDLNVVLYVAIGIALYVIAARGVSFLERRTGRPLGNRSLLLMAIFLGFMVLALWLVGVPGLPGLRNPP